MNQIVVEQLFQKPVEEQQVEIVERKGLGHPDSICDSIANRASVALCHEYVKVCGRVLHHNLDKATLVAGTSTPILGGGRVDKPMRLILGDRATSSYAGKTIDVPGIAIGAAKDWIRQNLRFVDPERHVLYQSVIEAGATELTTLLERDQPGANDTSAAVGFAPFTQTETTVLAIERHINSAEFRHIFPEAGEDVKVMGVRNGRELHLTIAIAFVSRLVPTRRGYFRRKDEIREHLLQFARRRAPLFENVTIDLNALDDPAASSTGMYLTVLGVSAEGADSGQVGRGNRAHGLISLARPQGGEAHAGKNPVNHIGKIYSYFSHHVAREIYSKVRGLREVYVYLCGQIGKPIASPLISSLNMILEPGASRGDVERPAVTILSEQLARINDFQRLLASEHFYSQWEAATQNERV